MAYLYNFSTKKWEEHDEDNSLNDKIASGQLAFPADVEIPVVSPDGSLGFIPSSGAADAFRDGFRFQTPQDRQARQQADEQDIIKRNFENAPVEAAVLGVARSATLGLSDVALDQAGLGDATKSIQDENRLASFAGEVGGAFMPGGAPALIGKGIKAVGEAGKAARTAIQLGEEAAGITSVAPSMASKIIEKYGTKAIGSTIEGAALGVGTGISESALGNGQDVVENIMTGMENGALWGGVLHGAFQGFSDAAPLIKSISKSTSNLFDKAIGKTARGMVKAEAPIVRARYGEEAADTFKEMVDTPESRQAMAMNPAKFEAAQKEAVAAEAAMKKDASVLLGGLNKAVKDEPKFVQDAIKKNVDDAQGDLVKALENMRKERVDVHGNYDMMLAAAQEPGQVAHDLVNKTLSAAKRLRESGESGAKAVADELENIIKSKIPEDILMLPGSQGRDREIQKLFTAGDEIQFARRIRENIPVKDTGLGKLGKQNRQELIDLREKVINQDLLKGVRDEAGNLKGKGHPNMVLANTQHALDELDKSYFALQKFVSSKAAPGSKVAKIASNPDRMAQLDVLLTNAAEFVPAMDRIKSKFKTVADEKKYLQDFLNRVNDIKVNQTGTKFTLDDIKELSDVIGKRGNRAANIEKLSQLQEALAKGENLSPVDKLLAYKRAMGEDISAELSSLAKLEPTYEKLNKLKALGGNQRDLLDRMSPFAYTMGGTTGTIVNAVNNIRNIGGNPYRTFKTLSLIERASNKGANMANKAISNTVDFLANKTVQKGAKYALTKEQSLKEIRKDYPKQQKILEQWRNPEFAVEQSAARYGSTLQSAPMIQAQMTAQTMKIAEYLLDKLPIDPMQSFSVNGMETGYVPSDSDLMQFNRYVRAVEDPMSVFDNIKRGSVTPEEVDVLKNIYPNLYNRLQTQLTNAIMETGGKNLSYAQKVMIGTLLDVPADISLQPEFIAKFQATHQQASPQNQGGRPEGTSPLKSVKIDINPLETVGTQTQRITNK